MSVDREQLGNSSEVEVRPWKDKVSHLDLCFTLLANTRLT